MQVKIINNIEEFNGLEPAWNEALAKSGSDNFFLRHEWLASWWQYYGQGNELFVVLLLDEGTIIAAAPLMIKHSRFHFRSLRFIAYEVTDYNDFIAIREPEECFKLISAEILRQHQRWDMLDLYFLREDSPHFTYWTKYFKDVDGVFGKQKNVDASVVIDLNKYGSWEEYFNKLSKKTRDDIKRQLNRLNKLGRISFDRTRTKEAGIQLFREFIAKHQARWHELSQASQFSDPTLVNKYLALIDKLAGNGLLDLSCLKLDGVPIAFHFGYVYNRCFFYYTPAFDPRYAAYSPGKILLKYLMENSFRDKLMIFDLLRGTEKYKLVWGDGLVRLFRLRSYQWKAKGLILCLAYEIFDGYRKIKEYMKNGAIGRKVTKLLRLKI